MTQITLRIFLFLTFLWSTFEIVTSDNVKTVQFYEWLLCTHMQWRTQNQTRFDMPLHISGMVSPFLGKIQNKCWIYRKCRHKLSDNKMMRRLCSESTHNVIKFSSKSAKTIPNKSKLIFGRTEWVEKKNLLMAGIKMVTANSPEWRSIRNVNVNDG